MKSLIVILSLLIVFFGQTSPAAGLRDAQEAFKSGNWKVLRSIDTMKDTVVCTGVFKDNYGIQLSADVLYVSIRGGIQGITLRFGDKPARSLRLPEKMEKDVGAVIISGSDFFELVESNRLRLQALTLVRGTTTEDLDLTGLKEAIENIRAGCPVQATSAATPKAEKPRVSPCTDVLISRMKEQGIDDSQILAICKQ